MKPKTHYNQNGSTTEGSSSGSAGNSPSPPRSPPRQNRRRLFRSKTSPIFRLESLAAGILLRRNLRYLFSLSLIYVVGLLLFVGPFSQPAPPGSVYRSHEMFRRLWPDIQSDNASAVQLSAVWSYKRSLKQQKPCPNRTVAVNLGTEKGSPGPTGYLIIEANGGLNQQRSAICNAVAVAGYLNAILVIPRFEYHSVWRDASEFADIFDEDHFITTLSRYVKVVKEPPEDLMERYNNSITNIPNFRVPAWAPVNYYSTVVYPILKKEGVIRIGPFANRLAMNAPPYIQFLRCLTNYRALVFSNPISSLANKLVQRMIMKSSKTGGKYVSVHLRFEEDMVAFSGCVYDGGRAEKNELDSIRESGWKKFKRKDHVVMPGLNRVNGRCPLTPLEVGMMLRGMGFDNNTSIFLASGKIYQAERHLAPLRKMFPLLHTKDTLATKEELAPFADYSSRLAALDYTVCLFSEVFVTTQGGNFPHLLMGHRRFLYGGHAKTIRPEKRELVVLLDDMNVSWNEFKDRMKVMLTASDRQSMLVPRVKKFNRKTSIYAFPIPECSCLQRPENSTLEFIHTAKTHHIDSTR